MVDVNSIRAMIPDFISIDFETASSYLDSACSVGIAFVKNLKVYDSFYSLINPNGRQFSKTNIEIHGITPEMVLSAPTFPELWESISTFFSENTPVLAHNAHFDMSVLKRSLGYEPQDFYYVDTISMVSGNISGSRSLKHCAEEFGISLDHHNAESDAVVCAQVAIKILEKNHCLSIWEYLAKNDLCYQIKRISELDPQIKMTSPQKREKKWIDNPSPSEIVRTNDTIDPSCPLCNASIVFTGELSIDRRTAMQLAVNSGAVVRSSVSKKTNYLVVGMQDKALVGDDGMSTKEEKAYELNSSGMANIKILNEEEFLNLVGNGVKI